MRLAKYRREAEQMFADLGLSVVESRGGNGSHVVYTVEYRGFHKATTVSMLKNQNRAKLNRVAELTRFKKTVDAIHRGEDPPMQSGMYRA